MGQEDRCGVICVKHPPEWLAGVPLERGASVRLIAVLIQAGPGAGFGAGYRAASLQLPGSGLEAAFRARTAIFSMVCMSFRGLKPHSCHRGCSQPYLGGQAGVCKVPPTPNPVSAPYPPTLLYEPTTIRDTTKEN